MQTLCASTPEALRRARWVRIKSSAELAQCVGLVSGGLRDATGNQLIVARKHYRNGYHVGNTGKNLPGIAFPWGGKERVEAADFEVLCVE